MKSVKEIYETPVYAAHTLTHGEALVKFIPHFVVAGIKGDIRFN